jgi:hypothetical protein
MSQVLTSSTVNNMPTETAFLKQAELAQTALRVFNAVCALDTPSVTRPALSELITATVRLSFIQVQVFG